MRLQSCFWMLAAVITVCRAETIHFTNSPTHLLGSRNFTTYKLLVKDAEPITIIEANKEINGPGEDVVTNRRSDIDITRKALIDTHDDDELVDGMKKTLSIDVPPIGMTVTQDVSPSEGTNRDTDGSDNGLKKMVYSPILLKKFVKEYTEKLKNADVNTKNAIKEISEKISQNGNSNPAEAAKHDEIEEKYNYNAFDRDRRRPASNAPYKDRDGWVTLEAVPWSSSTVSKWHGHYEDDRGDRPSGGPGGSGGSGYSSFNDRLYSVNSHRPASYHHEEEEYYRPKPYATRPVADDRPPYSAWSKPEAFSRPGRPQPHGTAYNDRDGWYDRDRPYSGRPWSGDIITDNRPSDFPKPHRRPGYNDPEPYTIDDEERYRPSAAAAVASSHSDQHVSANGEWVLISTTKGYQVPGRRQNGRRSLKFGVPSSMDTRDVTAHKSVKLTVLPALKSNSTFSSDPNKPAMVTSHGGMLEVESSQQTIEAAVNDARRQTTTKPPIKIPVKDTKKRKVLRGNST